MNVTENELLEAVRDALLPTGTESGQTLPEICAQVGKCRAVVARAIAALIKEDRAEHVKVVRVQMNGVARRTDGYRLK